VEPEVHDEPSTVNPYYRKVGGGEDDSPYGWQTFDGPARITTSASGPPREYAE